MLKNLDKKIILPILTVLALAVQLVFGVEIPEETLNELAIAIVNIVFVIGAIVGIFKNYKK